MTTVQELVEGAYARSASNDPGKLATEGELVTVANRMYQLVYAIMAAAAPERFTSRAVLAAMVGAPAATALSVDIIDVRRVQRASGAKVNVIPLEEVDRLWHSAPAVYRLSGALVSRGRTDDPVAGEVLHVFQLDAPAGLVNIASVLDARFPVRHIGLLIDEMAMYLSTKDEERNPTEFAKLKTARDLQWETMFQLSGLSMTAMTSPHGGAIIQRVNSLMAAAAAKG